MKRRQIELIIGLLLANALVRGDERMAVDLQTTLNGTTNGIVELREGCRGNLKTVFTWGDILNHACDQKRIEFTHVRFGWKGFDNRHEPMTYISSARTGTVITALYDSFVLLPSLPKTDTLATYRTIEQFKEVLKEGDPWIDGSWDPSPELHCGKIWYVCALAPSNSLRVLSVRLHAVDKRQERTADHKWTVVGLLIREAVFKTTGQKPNIEKDR